MAMTKVEILTLLAADVDPKVIAIAIASEGFSKGLIRAYEKVDQSMDFHKRAEWKELMRVMEGTLEDEAATRAERARERREFARKV